MEQEINKNLKDIHETSREQKTHRHHYSDSHRHHSSHSHHSRESFLKQEKEEEKKERSKLRRLQGWVSKKNNSKKLKKINLWALIFTILLLGVLFVLVAIQPDNQDANLNGGKVSSYGSYVSTDAPAHWKDMVNQKTKRVKKLQTAGGINSVSFAWASDTHIPDNASTKTDFLGQVMAAVMDNCDIPFAVLSGDIGSRGSYDTKEELEQRQAEISKHLAPLWGTERLLVALGNHDGCYGDSSGYYKKQYTPEQMWQFYFRRQALDFRRVFSEDGSYFYVDNIPQKTRFIVLNSQFGGTYGEDEEGWAINNRFSTSCYGQAQLNWLAHVALNMPEGYGAIITTHVPPKVLQGQSTPYTVDASQICGIINAYNNKTTFRGSYTAGVDGWTNSTVDVDFRGAKGEIIAMFAGHIHGDTVDTETLACPLITILSAGAPANEPYKDEEPEREVGTDTETSFDVVTINRKIRKIYCTRVGAGQDRVISY